MILMGTSASAAAVTAYLPAHAAYRMPGMKPIFDGFLPTSIGGTSPIMKVDVPVVMMPTMTEIVAEAVNGNRYRRPDGDAPGDQFRIYEVAGMAHNDSRVNPVYDPDPCRYPVSRFPQGMGVSAGVERLIQWIDKGRIPPRADYVVVVKRYVSPNEPHPMPSPNPSPLTAVASVQLFCSIAGYEVPLTHEQVQPLYRNKKDYQSKVEKRVKELIKEGWLTPSYKELILSDAMKVSLP
jgi:hypothetical protein